MTSLRRGRRRLLGISGEAQLPLTHAGTGSGPVPPPVLFRADGLNILCFRLLRLLWVGRTRRPMCRSCSIADARRAVHGLICS